jgi:predicted MFS family arabinose efflux permease
VLITAGTAVQSFFGYAVMVWAPTFMIRVHEMSLLDVSFQLGVAMGVCGVLGTYLGGKLADRVAARDARWYMRLPAIEILLGVPTGLAFLLLPESGWAIFALYPFLFASAMFVGPMTSMIQSLVAPNLRAQASAINLFVVNMVGLGLGPLAVGLLNDTVFAHHGALAIRYSLAVVALTGLVASGLFYLASRRLREDLATAQETTRS